MKLLTLLTTFIITLTSSNVFARTFLCENWTTEFDGERQGTMFVGEQDGDTFIIKHFKTKKTLTYIGVYAKFTYYTFVYNDLDTQIFSIEKNATKWSKDGDTQLGKYDFQIAELWGYGIRNYTFCNYQ